MRKFASAEILSVDNGTTGRTTLLRSAHRAVFHYTPREGFIYVRSRAISSRCNDNHDLFPADEIAQSYRTFIGKPVFVNHHNDDHKRMRGLVIDAALHQDRNPDGSPDTWAEVLMEIDGLRFPRLAQALIKGWIDRTSMGCDVTSSTCSVCANVATTPLEYCVHIPGKKGQRIVVTAADGRKEARLVYEECFVPETLVTLANGSQVSISTIQPGQEVLDHLGQPQRVQEVIAREVNEEIVILQRDGYQGNLQMTGNHPVLALRAQANGQRRWMRHRLEVGKVRPEFIPASEVRPGDFVAEAVPQIAGGLLKIKVAEWEVVDPDTSRDHPVPLRPDRYYTPERAWGGRQHILRDCAACGTEMDLYPSDAARIYCSSKCWGTGKARGNSAHGGTGTKITLPDTLEMTHDFGRWCGWFLAEGSVHYQVNKRRMNGIRFSLHRTETAHADEIVDLGHRLFGLIGIISMQGLNGLTVSFSSASLARLMRALGDDCYVKALPDPWLTAPIEFLRGVATAHSDGDGDHQGGRVGGVLTSTVHTHHTSSPRLADQLYLIRLMLGHTPTRKTPSPAGTGKRTVPNHHLWARSDQDCRGRFTWGNWVFDRVSHAGRRLYVGPVLNLHVSQTHTYVANGVAVHNCRGLSFFENSVLVEPPADPTAFFLGNVELGPGLQHLHALRLDKPTETMARAASVSPIIAELPILPRRVARRVQPTRDPLPQFQTLSQNIWAMLRTPEPIVQVRHIAYGETKAPQDVDTLRDEACPICGNDTAYAGRECQVCGYILPIKPFADPDVDKAKELDQLKQTVDDQLLAADPSRKGAPMPDGTDLDEAQQTGDDPASPTLACTNCATEFRPSVPQTTDAPGEKPVDGPAEGDICPECQQGELVSTGEPVDQDEELDEDADQLPGQDEQEDEDQSGNADPDDEDEDADDRLPASRRRKATKDRKLHRSEGELDTMQGLQALAAQQRLLDRQSAQITELTRLSQRQATQIQRLTAGLATAAMLGGDEVYGRVRLAMLHKRADEQNPAQPVPEPASQPPTMTTPQAKVPEAFADVTAPGMVPGTTQDVAADAVTTAYTPGQDIAAAPFRQLVDVTAPVEGTQGPRPINETRTEVDVRAGNTMNPQVAFPMGGPFTQQQRTTGSLQAELPPNDMRFVSCLRLARLKLQQGIAQGEDLSIAQRLAADSNLSQELIDMEINTLSSVQKAASARQSVAAPAGMVPRPANGVQRTVPAMASMASIGGGSRSTLDDDAASIFLPDDFGE